MQLIYMPYVLLQVWRKKVVSTFMKTKSVSSNVTPVTPEAINIDL